MFFLRRRLLFDDGMLVGVVNHAWVNYTGGYVAAFNLELEGPRLEREDPSGIIPL